MRDTFRLGDTGDRLTGALAIPGGTADTEPQPPAPGPTPPEPGPPTAEHGEVPACGGIAPALAVFDEGGNRQASNAATVDMLLEAHVESVLVDCAGLMDPAEEAPPPAVTATALVLLLVPAIALEGG